MKRGRMGSGEAGTWEERRKREIGRGRRKEGGKR